MENDWFALRLSASVGLTRNHKHENHDRTDTSIKTESTRRCPATEGRPCIAGLTGAFRPRRAILRLMRPVDALYENGLLRPVSPLPLRSGERVALIVVRRPDSSRWDFARLTAHADDDLALAEAGLDEWAAALDREDRG